MAVLYQSSIDGLDRKQGGLPSTFVTSLGFRIDETMRQHSSCFHGDPVSLRRFLVQGAGAGLQQTAGDEATRANVAGFASVRKAGSHFRMRSGFQPDPEARQWAGDLERPTMNAAGLSPALLDSESDGTAAREGFRRFVNVTLAHLAGIVEEEASTKLDMPVSLDLSRLRGIDAPSLGRAIKSEVDTNMATGRGAEARRAGMSGFIRLRRSGILLSMRYLATLLGVYALAVAPVLTAPLHAAEDWIETVVGRFQLFNHCGPMTLYTAASESVSFSGITQERLRLAVESRLRGARIYRGDSDDTNTPELSVIVTAAGPVFLVHMQFRTWVARTTKVGVRLEGSATTWSLTAIGLHEDGADKILSKVSECLDKFITAYLTANEDACRPV